MGRTRNYCALQGYKIACRDRLELHHIISFGKVQGNKKIKALLKTNPPELTIHLCQRHHQRYGRSRAVRRKLLEMKIDEYGYLWMEYLIDNLPWKVKLHSLTLKGLLA